MSKLLASVNSIEEAMLALQMQVDIIDLKQPANGALGALEIFVVNQIVTEIAGHCPVSATVGDLPMLPDLVFNAVKDMANTGVDYIKIGFFPQGDYCQTINKLAELTVNYNLIAVLFADGLLDFSVIKLLKQAGFKGVMLDTIDKSCGSLTQIMAFSEIERFIELVKSENMLCGLAGSIKLNEVSQLLSLKADYLGFRSALCEQQQRINKISPKALSNVKQAMFGFG